jgi:hypothetical protein
LKEGDQQPRLRRSQPGSTGFYAQAGEQREHAMKMVAYLFLDDYLARETPGKRPP